MKKITAFILAAVFALSITACGSRQNAKPTSENALVSAQSGAVQGQSNSAAAAAGSKAPAAAVSTSSKAAVVNPNEKFTGKPVPKEQMENAAKDLKDTLSQIQDTMNSLDTVPDVNTDNIQ